MFCPIFARLITISSILCLLSSCISKHRPINSSTQTFAWPFIEDAEMQVRGGITKGTEVVLDPEPSPHLLLIQQKELSSFEKDRNAILAMTGNFRTSFQFIETDGFTENYTPARPYFSWTTEHVKLLEDSGNFISLQHILVMFMKGEGDTVEGPFIMKHWRQDWTFEKDTIFEYIGNSSWLKRHLLENELKGKWTQSVYQVDDSIRYNVIGSWTHKNQYSTWISKKFLRPLPRREFSVREDYNLLEGVHQITLNSKGWTHEQQNLKIKREGNTDKYLAKEIGFNRYERISSPSLAAADDHWSTVSTYWRLVRKAWDDIFSSRDSFRIKEKTDGTKLWQIHFKNAQEIEKSGEFQSKDWANKIRLSIDQFVEDRIQLNDGRALY